MPNAAIVLSQIYIHVKNVVAACPQPQYSRLGAIKTDICWTMIKAIHFECVPLEHVWIGLGQGSK